MGKINDLFIGATRVPENDIIEVEMIPNASTLKLGERLKDVQVKSYKYKLWGIYDVKRSDDGAYRFTRPKKPVGGKRNKTRKVRRNRKRNTRRR